MKTSKKVKKAMEKAEREVRKEALKPKKKRKMKSTEQQASPSGRWINDEWGNQERVFFNSDRYWGTFIEPGETPGVLDIVSRYWSAKKWEERKKQENTAPILETMGMEKPLSSTLRITKSTKSSKRVLNGKFPTKSGKTATPVKQRKWR